ncbi:Programmed cell death protein 2 [Coemansia sp. RSA 2440]|nr:Programmed cell death protein 2 [Coemansia sp. RSA 2440]
MLLVSDTGAPTNVPACEACGTDRQFEFQIMPQMLNYLNLDSTDPHSIDWGTLLVFTCPVSCEPTDTFMPEVVCKQSFSSHGIGQKYLRAYYGDEDAFSRQFESLDV